MQSKENKNISLAKSIHPDTKDYAVPSGKEQKGGTLCMSVRSTHHAPNFFPYSKNKTNHNGNALRLSPQAANIPEYLLANKKYHKKSLRLYLAVKMLSSGLVPVKRDKIDTWKRQNICRKMGITEGTFYSYVSNLRTLGLLHKDKFNNLCIRGEKALEPDLDWDTLQSGDYNHRRVKVPRNCIRTHKQFKLFIQSAIITLKIDDRKRNKKYLLQSAQEMANRFIPLEKVGLTLTKSELESYMQDAYAAEYFTQALDRDRSTVSRIRKQATQLGYLNTINTTVRCEFSSNPNNINSLKELQDIVWEEMELCSEFPGIREDSNGFYFNMNLPAQVQSCLKVRNYHTPEDKEYFNYQKGIFYKRCNRVKLFGGSISFTQKDIINPNLTVINCNL